jgi:hypothetical protein
MFITFIETGHNHLLKHPLCESFLHLKWLKVRKFFMVSLSFHLVFTMLHTAFVLQVYSSQCFPKAGGTENFKRLKGIFRKGERGFPVERGGMFHYKGRENVSMGLKM